MDNLRRGFSEQHCKESPVDGILLRRRMKESFYVLNM
jgi:hypothetical protein